MTTSNWMRAYLIGRSGGKGESLGPVRVIAAAAGMIALTGTFQEARAQFGACCFQYGACTITFGENECCFDGGVWQGDNTTCETANCAQTPVGACCNSGQFIGGPECYGVMTSCNCQLDGGVGRYYLGDGTVCTQCPQLSGACCTPGFNCIYVTSNDCLAANGVWRGVRVPCDGSSCPTCYPNCDGSTGSPVLNVADFTCFFQKFATGDPYANCDGSTTDPVLNVQDFICFLQKFAQGCP